MMRSISNPVVLDETVRRIEGLSIGSPRRWGKMNIQQMLAHLAGAMDRVLAGEELPKMSGPNPKVMKFIALTTPIPWPRGVKSAGKPADVDVPEADFEANRRRVIEALQQMASWQAGPDTPAHPVFGKLTTAEWRRWAFRHAHHHLKQFSS